MRHPNNQPHDPAERRAIMDMEVGEVRTFEQTGLDYGKFGRMRNHTQQAKAHGRIYSCATVDRKLVIRRDA